MLTALLFMLALYAMHHVLTSPSCPWCGKKLAHAKDCNKKKD